MTKVLSCNCPNEQQDKIHGRGLRVHNLAKPTNPVMRCTVCSNEKAASVPAKKKK